MTKLFRTSRVVLSGLAMVVSSAWAAPLTVSDGGLGPIVATTKFNQAAIQSLLPAYVVKNGKRTSEGESYKVFLITDKGKTLATVNPGDGGNGIFSIRIASTQIENALGHKLGTSYLGVFGANVNKACTAGEEELSGKVICPAPKSTHVSYLFKGVSNGPDGTVPALAMLKNFVLEEIIWKP